jgi:hypothetical protein
MRPVRSIAAALRRASLALAVLLVPLLVAVAMIQPAQAAAANPFPLDDPPVTPDHEPPWLVPPGEPLALSFGFENWYDPLSPGVLYVRNDTQRGFTRLPLPRGDSLVARVPGGLVRGHQLLYYAVLRNPATGKTVTVPAGGARDPQRVWIVDRPLAVPLGAHGFGHPRPPDAIVAHAGPDQIGFDEIVQEGVGIGPQSFDIARDGSVWLLDGVNARLLVWRPGRPDRPVRTVRVPRLVFGDFTLAPDGTIYLIGAPPGGTQSKTFNLYALAPSGQLRWAAPTVIDLVEDQLRVGPDGVIYSAPSWTPLTTPTGRPLPLDQQRPVDQPPQPLPGGLRLAHRAIGSPGLVGAHEWRFALTTQIGRLVRAWRVTSQTLMSALVATPALVGGDPVLVVEVGDPNKPNAVFEEQVLRLAPTGGTSLRFALPFESRLVFDGEVTTGLRVGPDGQLYQLRTSRTSGVSIARYSLGPTQVARPTPKPAPFAPPAPTPTLTQTPPTTPAPTVTLPPAQLPARPASQPARWWLIPGLLAAGAGTLAALGVWLWYRRQHPAGPRGPGRSRLAH